MEEVYTQLTVVCPVQLRNFLIAGLGELGFDSFLETNSGFIASTDRFDAAKSVIVELLEHPQVNYRIEQVEKRNWNEEWEKSVHPVRITDRCLIRASFHDPHPEVEYEIVITPRMSFGTGHHATTQLMLAALEQLEDQIVNLRVMDAGCGTGVLSIMASKMGAGQIDAFDIDDWSVENAVENLAVNHCSNVRVQKGTVSDLDLPGPYHILLANINKSVLMQELSQYMSLLSANGLLLLSGFYESDAVDLLKVAKIFGFAEQARTLKDNWCCLVLKGPQPN